VAIAVCTIVVELALVLTPKVVRRRAWVGLVADAGGLILILATVITSIADTAHWDAILAIIFAVKLALQVTGAWFVFAIFLIRTICAVFLAITEQLASNTVPILACVLDTCTCTTGWAIYFITAI